MVLFLLSYILLKMATSQKFSNDYGMVQLQNEQFTNKTLDERECSTKCSQKMFLKTSQISLQNTCAE